MTEQSIAEIDLHGLTARPYFPSPVAWEDEVLYFLMLDRFSDGRETDYVGNDGSRVLSGTTQPFGPADAGNAPRAAWVNAGQRFRGGTLRGLSGKIGYLKRLGVSAVWISPIFKQLASRETYHGYGVQNFLDVDPRFGSREDLRALVQTAHEHGIRVVLDIILNHTGDVFAYDADRYEIRRDDGSTFMDPRWDRREYRAAGFRAADGVPTLPFGPVDLAAHPGALPDGAVWPSELQAASTFTRKGRISNWDFDPEFLEGDFSDLKNVHLGQGGADDYHASDALKTLAAAYKFWIAFADIDGFRVDTVKHMDLGASRFFGSVIHEFAQAIGKENFYLIAEITGGRTRAFQTLETTGLDAALGVDEIPDKVEYLVKGYRNPEDYFSLFRNSLLVQKDSHVWFRNKVVTMFDDHDQVRKGNDKARFCADPDASRQVLSALALNATTLGIPCIYYGTEQAFDGHGPSDQFLRETMFGGDYGAFQSRGRHFFLENGAVYKELAKILRVRREKLALRRGRQYLREISGNGAHFGFPRLVGNEIRSVVPWSRIFDEAEIVLALNTDPHVPRSAWVTIDDGLHRAGDVLRCLYSTDPAQIGRTVTVEARNGKAVELTLPAAGFVIYE
ncbi:MAG TPA: alpha-amylase family glycosyl hydrolase [Gammaproteobacteria bacterium]|nr:alpha-amylase family glycosyl hydrolase [Gammaproteobacteria bacterium]